jgi:hypothetical protein
MTDVDADTDADADADADANADAAVDGSDDVTALAAQEGWQAEGYAARVHYRGADDHYSVEYYEPSGCVLYWKVRGDGEIAVPVGRETVPDPLRERVRLDLREAGIDPEVEGLVV